MDWGVRLRDGVNWWDAVIIRIPRLVECWVQDPKIGLDGRGRARKVSESLQIMHARCQLAETLDV